MECISVFDMLKVGVGPSSSHTLGPWRAAELFLKELHDRQIFDKVISLKVDLFGSLSLTGIGHATDLAVILGLSGADPEYVPIEDIDKIVAWVRENKTLNLGGQKEIVFNPDTEIIFNRDFLPFHANGMSFTVQFGEHDLYTSTFYSIGGGFVVKEDTADNPENDKIKASFPYPIDKGTELLAYCKEQGKKVSEIVYENEKSLRSEEEISKELLRVWDTMLECIYIGCHTEGTLQG